MNLCFNTDSLGYMSFEEMLDTAAELGFDSIEIACGNWSKAPHIDLDNMLENKTARNTFMEEIEKRGLTLATLNCSGNQLAPNEEGKEHQKVVEKTFQLAEKLNIKHIVMMSGLPGGSPTDVTPNWITSSWPPITTKILNWQWNEVFIPYWQTAVERAKSHGIEKIALENHGYQLVYNPGTLIRLRDAVGPMIGMNIDPGHLFWMGGDPIVAVRKLGAERIYHVHAKDARMERSLLESDGVLDTKTIDQFSQRTWNYVALGHGHSVQWWKEFFSVLSMIGYTGSVSLEMEDLTMSPLTGIKKSLNVLKEALPNDYE
ncbi:Sugar phosphate isomerase/epimerase [Pelosinus fermentans]|uniref:sugar phosphate isomerase/epimerase family protein n=1 Tax=Pelosinus fermentans TaxID=365349 RepID=UPI0002685612|nr:sugar phosphate isomerase/epimerase [Pelosinus fermentans]OAM96375.1 Xylose isomerase domain-containing protein TIM barrel [Pelosinus fermentans DSM 17108]SDR39471.1 Sugar phosphate isomerase/epimerase [Pelosinus fermentans]